MALLHGANRLADRWAEPGGRTIARYSSHPQDIINDWLLPCVVLPPGFDPCPPGLRQTPMYHPTPVDRPTGARRWIRDLQNERTQFCQNGGRPGSNGLRNRANEPNPVISAVAWAGEPRWENARTNPSHAGRRGRPEIDQTNPTARMRFSNPFAIVT